MTDRREGQPSAGLASLPRRVLLLGTVWALLLAACQPATTALEGLAPEMRAAARLALDTETQAKRIAETASPQKAIATDIYEGPAVMAVWRGESVSGPYQGLGVLELPDSGVTYAGRFIDGLLDGPGVWRDVEGRLLFAGTFKAGNKEGPGAEYGPDGAVVASGLWRENSLTPPPT